MTTLANNNRSQFFVKSITALVSGLIWTMSPKFVSGLLGLVFGLIIVIKGAIDLVMLIMSGIRSEGGIELLLESIFSLTFGGISMMTPYFFSSVLTIIIGLYFIVDGFVKHSSTLLLREMRTIWWVGLVLNIIEIILGILILVDPVESTISLIIIGGIVLIMTGINYALKFLFYREQ